MDQGLLQGLIAGLQSGVESYQKQKQITQRDQELASDRKRQNQMLDIQMQQAGLILDPKTGQLIETPEHKEQRELDKQYKKAQSQHLQAETASLYNKKSKGRELPAGSAENLSGSQSAVAALDDVSQLVNAQQGQMGPARGLLSKAQGFLGVGQGGQDARTFEAVNKQRAQIIGKYLEGGKLTDADIQRYQQQLPQVTDSPQVAQNKIDGLKRLIQQKYDSEVTTLGASGFDVSAVPRLGGQPALPGLDGLNRGGVKSVASPHKTLDQMTNDELKAYINGK